MTLLQPVPKSRNTKKHYSFETKLNHFCGQLSQQEKKSIPRSTLCSWKKSVFRKNFLTGDLWEKINTAEPASFPNRNRSLINENRLLVSATIALSAILKSKPLTIPDKKHITSGVDRIRGLTGLPKACSYFSISTHQYHAWKNNGGCHQSAIRLCRRKFPNQLTTHETGLIKKYMEDAYYGQWSRISIYWQLCKKEGYLFARSTFYKYCKTLGYGRRKGFCKCKKNSTGIRAGAVGQIIHADITELYCKNQQKAYVLFVQDNFSRKIIGFHAARQNNSLLQAATIKLALQNLGNAYLETAIITDGGSENKGRVDEMLKAFFPEVHKITARADVPFANNMVEALHYKMKYQVLPQNGFDCFNSIAKTLPDYVGLYNNMPHDSLHGCTPNEVFVGIKPDFNNRLLQLKQAAAARLHYNKGFACCNA